MKPSDHYRYDWLFPPRPQRARVRAILNDGHTGSILNCTHADCVTLRDQRRQARLEERRADADYFRSGTRYPGQ